MKAFVSGRKHLTLRCGSSSANSFILKGEKPEVEVIIVGVPWKSYLKS